MICRLKVNNFMYVLIIFVNKYFKDKECLFYFDY